MKISRDAVTHVNFDYEYSNYINGLYNATECSFISLHYKWNCREAIFWFEPTKNNRVVTCDIEVRMPVKDDRS